MTASPPPEYVLARSALLDALQALGPHLDALVLVGAQAVYLPTVDADLIVVPTTTDADLAGSLSGRGMSPVWTSGHAEHEMCAGMSLCGIPHLPLMAPLCVKTRLGARS